MIEKVRESALKKLEGPDADNMMGAVIRRNANQAFDALFAALNEAGCVVVPKQLDHKNMKHWKIAHAGISFLEANGCEFSGNTTPENAIAEAYTAMLTAAQEGRDDG